MAPPGSGLHGIGEHDRGVADPQYSFSLCLQARAWSTPAHRTQRRTVTLLVAGFSWTVALALLALALRRWPSANLLLLVIVPTVLLPWMIASERRIWSDASPFLLAKLISVTLVACGAIAAFRFRSRITPKQAGWAAYLIVALNILEAIAQDALVHHSLNALAGLVLLATMPRPIPVRFTNQPTTARTVDFALSVPWIAAYTLWNLAFGTIGWPSTRWTILIATLAAAAIVATRGSQRWLEARSFTLAAVIFISFFDDLGWAPRLLSSVYHPWPLDDADLALWRLGFLGASLAAAAWLAVSALRSGASPAGNSAPSPNSTGSR
jgi:hypothetical protein